MELAVEELLGFITSEYEAWSSTGMLVCPTPRGKVYEASGSRVRQVADGISGGSLQALLRRCAKERGIPFVKAVQRYDFNHDPASGSFVRKYAGRTIMFRRRKNLEFVIALFVLFGIDGYKQGIHDRALPIYFLGKSQFAVIVPEAIWADVFKMITTHPEWRRVMQLDGKEQECLPALTCTTKSRRSTKPRASTAPQWTAG